MKLTFVLIFISLIGLVSNGQGCSDAGACSAGSMDLKNETGARGDLTLSYNQSVGLADKESLILASELKVSQRIFPSSRLEFRLPYMVTIGNLATTSGVGDLLVSLSQDLYQNENSTISIVAGGRLKTNDANKSKKGQPLPMVYQSSLGTNDIIAGVAWKTPKWSVSAGYQHAFGANENEYLHPDSTDLPDSKLYFESAFLRRGDDLLLRIQRTVELNESGTLNFGFLPIYRMQYDKIKRNGVYEELPGSKGITYNLFFNWFRLIDSNKLFTFTAGFPIHTREYRADGLTRTVILNAGIVFKFQPIKKEIKPVHDLFDPLNPDK